MMTWLYGASKVQEDADDLSKRAQNSDDEDRPSGRYDRAFDNSKQKTKKSTNYTIFIFKDKKISLILLQ